MSGSISQAKTEVFVGERDGSVTVSFVRTGDLSRPVNVTYDVSAESATSGDDFRGQSGVARFDAGSDRATVNIAILDDALFESTEVFAVSIVAVDSGTMAVPRTTRINILDDENPVLPPTDPPFESAYDVTFQRVAGGLNQPINLEIAPARPGIGYVAQKGGLIRTVDLATGADLGDFVDLSRKVNETVDRGLLDIALHPDFLNTPYVYAFYVVDPPGLTTAELDQNFNRYAHLVRFTADSSKGYLEAIPGSEVVLLGNTGMSRADISGGGLVIYSRPEYSSRPSSEQTLNPNNQVPVVNGFKQNYIKVDAASHAGGALAFGPDGMLYVSTGDGTSPGYADPRSPHVQSLDSLSGKILRIDPVTGEGLTDNPFYSAGMSLESNKAKVWQFGLRNPFSMGFDDDGRLFISDTGWNKYEEINSGSPGANFGWPWYEGGPGGTSVKTSGYQNIAGAAAFYAAVENGTIQVAAPYASFGHAEAVPGYKNQAITAGSVIYDGNRYPAAFADDFFFTNFSEGHIFTIDTDNRQDVKYVAKAPGLFAPAHFMQGPDGFVYYVDLAGATGAPDAGSIGRLLITEKGPPPPPPPPSDNLLVNGSFEGVSVPQGGFLVGATVPGWQPLAGGQIELWSSHRGVTPTDGVNNLELDVRSARDGLYQDVATIAGSVYELTFDATRRPGTSASTNVVEVLWNGALVAKVTPTTLWAEYDFTVTGTGGLDRLTFREASGSFGDGLGAMLDDFVLVAQDSFLLV